MRTPQISRVGISCSGRLANRRFQASSARPSVFHLRRCTAIPPFRHCPLPKGTTCARGKYRPGISCSGRSARRRRSSVLPFRGLIGENSIEPPRLTVAGLFVYSAASVCNPLIHARSASLTKAERETPCRSAAALTAASTALSIRALTMERCGRPRRRG
jgi:hypothetical protein